MNTPRISFSISFLTQVPEGFRLFVVGSIISVYGLILYELFPEFLFNPNFSLYYFAIPMGILGAVGIVLPRAWPLILEKILKKPVTKPQSFKAEDSDDILNQLVTEGSSQLVQQDPYAVMPDYSGTTGTGEVNKELDAIIASTKSPSLISDENRVGVDSSSLLGGESILGIGEDKIRDLIDQKFEPVEKDLSAFKKDLNKIKEDMKMTKESVDTLTESFEGTLTDMKAFQAEIANPLNFMRKYFESIDLKSIQDPSLPLRQQLQDNSVPTEFKTKETQTIIVPGVTAAGQLTTNIPSQEPTEFDKITKSNVTKSSNEETQLNPMDSVMKPLFSGNLTVGKMMSIIELAGDMLREQGDDCIDLLIEQCKLMGLKPEDENTIYNIIDMLKNSGMNVEDSLMQLYKFSKIVGMTDKEADAHYAKLIANRKRVKKSDKGD
jgi:hypothetical protein